MGNNLMTDTLRTDVKRFLRFLVHECRFAENTRLAYGQGLRRF